MAVFSDSDALSPTARLKLRHLPWAPRATLAVAALMLVVSYWLPYWQIQVVTPAHPEGVRFVSYLGRLDGPLPQILAAAGWPGGRADQDPVALERSLSLAMAVVVGLLLTAATLRSRWRALLAVPAICFPIIVVADTARWLVAILATLSPESGPLRIGPAFLLLGRLAIAGATLNTRPGVGFVLAIAASMTGIVGLLWLSWTRRRSKAPIRRGAGRS